MSRKMLIALLIVFVLSACGSISQTTRPISTPIPSPTIVYALTPSATAFPANELSPYYGEPQPAQIIMNDEIYNSKIGTTKWITEVFPDGTYKMIIGDAFAIITPAEPIIVKHDFAFVLKLPIPINPTELWYAVYNVSEQELNTQDTTDDALRWKPDYATQTYHKQTNLLLVVEQELNLSLESGFYVIEIHASWGVRTELEADYGFLLKVQE